MKRVFRNFALAPTILFMGLAASVSISGTPTPDTATAKYLDSAPGADWPGYGRTFGEQHYSPLGAINDGNVGKLGLVWSADLPAGNSVSQPIEVDGTLYVTTGYSIVRAYDARTGRSLWNYDPKVPEAAGIRLRGGWGARGLAWWNGKIYIGTMDGRLIAIDAKTGHEVWSVVTTEKGKFEYITGAPRVFDGKVIIGFGGADLDLVRGYVTSYDAETGKQLWRWYAVPGNPAADHDATTQAAASSWAGKWWDYGGGGTVWNAMTYDPETDTIFVGTGNGVPWNHKVRSLGQGDNLYLCSIVALDAKTGKYKWHYQINPGETWDYNAAMDMPLATIMVDGKPRKVIMQAPKNGFYYVIDRVTGKLISAEPWVKVSWASKIDLTTGRPVEDPASRYPAGTVYLMYPRTAHGSQPMAYSPASGLAYIPTLIAVDGWSDYGIANDQWRKESPPSTGQSAAIRNPFASKDPENGTSRLIAWDPRTQKQAWAHQTPGPVAGGLMATAGNLVFQGQLDNRFNAYDAKGGKLLWSYDTKAPVTASPLSYSVGGRQYVTVVTGMGLSPGIRGDLLTDYDVDYRSQKRRVLTFAVGGTKELPAERATKPRPI
jgi:quinohemoprotein ethanol dehydrogenase